MQCDVTLTADEFKTIHNNLFYLDAAVSRLERVLNEGTVEQLSAASAAIRGALKNAYEQEHTASDRRHRYYTAVGDECKYSSVWSLFTVDDFYTEHPWPKANWVKIPGSDTKIPIPGVQWIDLWDAADRAIRASGDSHHIYIESFVPGSEVGEAADLLMLGTGS